MSARKPKPKQAHELLREAREEARRTQRLPKVQCLACLCADVARPGAVTETGLQVLRAHGGDKHAALATIPPETHDDFPWPDVRVWLALSDWPGDWANLNRDRVDVTTGLDDAARDARWR